MNQIDFCARIALVVGFGIACPLIVTGQEPHLLNGAKIGEVTSESAILWTRVTGTYETETDWPDVNGKKIPGLPGDVQIVLKSEDGSFTSTIPWQSVDSKNDCTLQTKLTNLKPSTKYKFEIIPRYRSEVGKSLFGSFKTAPDAKDLATVHFTVVTGQGYHRRDDGDRGHKIFKSMLEYSISEGETEKVRPDFFVHTGDIVYYDKKDPIATNIELARHHWHRMYALENQFDFHCQVPSYFMKDDHDTLFNDCWPGFKNKRIGELSFDDGLRLFREQVPMGEKTYRTFRWGKDLQIWLAEGRDFRSPNNQPDSSDKTIWGSEQIKWFQDGVKTSDATFKVLISPTPIVGPDRKTKNDNHANDGFKTEGDLLRQFLKENNVVVICGDRHWQYVSQDPDTSLMEYACGPTSNAHAGGFSKANESSMHKFLRIKGGFLSATVQTIEGKPAMSIRHHDVDGDVVNTSTIDNK